MKIIKRIGVIIIVLITLISLSCMNPVNPFLPEKKIKGLTPGGEGTETLGGSASISGTNRIGGTLTVVTTGITGTGDNKDFIYQWKAGGSDLQSAAGSTYKIKGSDAGKLITCVITHAEAEGSITATGETVPYNITVTIQGNVTGDSVTLNPDFGTAGSVITLTCNVANHKIHNIITFGGVEEPPLSVNEAGNNKVRTYTVKASDADNEGLITITAKFEHVDKTPNKINFADTKNEEVVYGVVTSYTKAITNEGYGDGEITYSSSNTDVATVTNTGEVTIKKAGITEITATKAEDDNYAETAASYTLTVLKAQGAVINDLPTLNINRREQTTITINAAGLSESTGQTIEYVISSTNSSAPAAGWQTGLTFENLTAGTFYYIWARSMGNENYLTGIASVSLQMQTLNPSAGVEIEITDSITQESVTIGGSEGSGSGSNSDPKDIALGGTLTFEITDPMVSDIDCNWFVGSEKIGTGKILILNSLAFSVGKHQLIVVIYKNENYYSDFIYFEIK